MSQQHICKRLFLGNRPKPYAGKPWGTRDLEAKSWQIASSVKVGLNVSYSVKIICFSLQVSTEHWVNSGYFLWEGKQSIWQSCAQWDIFRGFPPSLSPPAQHTQAIGSAVFPRSCCGALGTTRPVWDGNTPWAALVSITTAWWTSVKPPLEAGSPKMDTVRPMILVYLVFFVLSLSEIISYTHQDLGADTERTRQGLSLQPAGSLAVQLPSHRTIPRAQDNECVLQPGFCISRENPHIGRGCQGAV